MRLKGLEPSRLAAPDPKSGASTNFATSANVVQRYEFSHLSPKYSEEKIVKAMRGLFHLRLFLIAAVCFGEGWRDGGLGGMPGF